MAATGESIIMRYLLQLHACVDEHSPWPVILLSNDDPSSSPSVRTALKTEAWHFASPNPDVAAAGESSILRYLLQLHACVDEHGPRPVIPLSHDDPSSSPSFRTTPEAEVWRFTSPIPAVAATRECGILRYLLQMHACIDKHDPRPVIPLSHGDPSSSPSFHTAPEAEEVIIVVVRSGEYNGYPSPPPASLLVRRCPASSSHYYCFRISFIALTALQIVCFS